MLPSSMRWPPNQMVATIARFMISISVGKMRAKSRVTFSVVWVRSSFATANRSSSCAVRTKARITLMPVRFSRRTPFTASIFTCMTRNSGTAFAIISPMTISISGTVTSRRLDSWTFSRMAMMMPPIAVTGASTIIVSPTMTSIWSCCTSLVLRVIRDGTVKRCIWARENSSTRRNRSPRRSRPKRIDVRALK